MDKDLNVRINLAAGSDQASRVLAEQNRLAKELYDRLSRVRGLQGAAPELSFARLQAKQEARLNADRGKVLPAITGRPSQGNLPMPREELSEARQLAKAEVQIRKEIAERLSEARDKEIYARAYKNVTGRAAPGTGGLSQLRQAADSFGGVGPLGSVLHGFERATSAGTSGLSGLAAAALPMGALFGAATAAAGFLVPAIENITSAFRMARESIQNFNDRLTRGRSARDEIRQTGVATARTAGQLLTGAEQQEFQQAQQGTPEQQRHALRRLRDRAQQEVQQAQAADPEAADAAYRALLERQQRMQQGMTEGQRQGWSPFFQQERERFFRERGMDPSTVPVEQLTTGLGASPITDANIRAMSTVFRNRVALAQGRLEFAQAGLRTGLMPNLREGAVNLEDLPNVFQSRQGDVLDLHSQVQQDAVRDMREQQRFEAMMTLLEAFHRDVRQRMFGGIA